VSAEPSLVRLASQWFLAIIVAILATAFFLALSAVQVTSEDTGQRIHRRAAAELTDIDAVLPSIETALDDAAADGEGDTVLVPGFPIPVELTREEAATLRGDDLKQRLLHDSGRLLYQDGMSMWAEGDPEGRQEIDNVSSAAAVYRTLDLVRESTNTYFVVLSVLLGILTLILSAVLLWSIRSGFMRLLAAGVILLVASMPALAAAVAVRFALKTAQADGDTFVEGMLELGADVMWLPIRLYLALSMVGFATVGIASIGMWLESRTPSRTVTPTN
jgi:hypothetical protein